MIRVLAAIAFCFALTASMPAHAGDVPCNGRGQGQGDCQAPLPPRPVPAPPQQASGFCDGSYDGFLANQPGPLSLEIRSVDDCGHIEVTGRWADATWVGRGFCRQLSDAQAAIVFQYPNTPVQRGYVTILRDGNAELDGAVDGGDSFRLIRH
jgi:hypothetical protein